MIGNWLNTISPEVEARLLTGKLGICELAGSAAKGCLLQVAYDNHTAWANPALRGYASLTSYRRQRIAELRYEIHACSLPAQYDALLGREWDGRSPHGRLANAIRTRILRNQLRRTLAAPHLTESHV